MGKKEKVLRCFPAVVAVWSLVSLARKLLPRPGACSMILLSRIALSAREIEKPTGCGCLMGDGREISGILRKKLRDAQVRRK